jgi:NAD(P)-dependent dehydrogenase (short-subunit alcohol dehydrogenase family)
LPTAPPAQPRTIGDVVQAMQDYLESLPAGGVAEPMPPAGSRQPAASDRGAMSTASADETRLQQIVDVVANVTQYPKELLQPGAKLEEDLGFGQAQTDTIFAEIQRRLGLSPSDAAARGAARTIGDIAASFQPRVAVTDGDRHRLQDEPSLSQAGTDRQPLPNETAYRPFAGRIALVTGSGHGLGKVIARQLACWGATVVVNSFHSRQRGEETTAEILASGGQAVHLWGSVANSGQLERIFGEIDQRFGNLDFFISNASNGVLAPLTDVTPEHWDRAFRTSVIALQQGSLRAADLMRRRGGGKIVAISSNGSQRYLDYFGCMGPVKAAVECLVRYLAVELGVDNIQVNAVAAGPIYGELLDKYPDYDKLRPRWEAVVPRKRLNDEQEVADAVMFLLTTSGMTGSVLAIDAGGGQRISIPLPESS